MNQGRIWCVVHPTVGLPLLLGSVALTSLAVHASVMQHTSWMSNYWQGSARAKLMPPSATSDNASPSKVAAVASPAQPAFLISVAPVAAIPGRTESAFVVTVAPNPAATTTVSGEASPAASTAVAVAAAKLE